MGESVFTIIAFFVIGAICLIWPKKIRYHALKWSEQTLGKYFKPFLLLDHMKTQIYIWELRILGVLSICGAIFVFYVLFISK
jgi:hypothetical protein